MAKLAESLHDKECKTKGKPFKFKTVEELQQGLDAYFADPNEVPWTVSGLALFLGVSRTLLLDYSGRNGYAEAIRIAKARVEASVEKRLLKPDGAQSAGIIFSLCNNWRGWHQKQETNSTIAQTTDLRVSGGLTINWATSDSTH